MDSVTSALAEASEAFFGAVRRGEARRVQELLHAHPTVLERPDPGGKRPLMVALSEGHGNVVEVLLKKGADHSQPDMSGNSPLHVVAGKGNFEALGVFLKNVQLPHINCTNGEGDSVLMGSAGRGFSIIVECLLQHNADPNITNKAGRTPIMEAARKGHKEVIKVLLRFGADILLTSHEVMSY
jgi:ankyrin repeat protein